MKLNRNARCCCCSLKCGVKWILAMTVGKLIVELLFNLALRFIDASAVVTFYAHVHLVAVAVVQVVRVGAVCATLCWTQIWCPYDTWMVTVYMNIA